MLLGRDEECSVNQWIPRCRLFVKGNDSAKCFFLPLKDDHLVVAEDTGDLVHLVSCIAGEDEASRFVITDTAFILHLNT